MAPNDWLNLIGSVGLIGAGSLVGSLITVVITHFLERGKLKTERQSNLQKEIYFKLQEQAAKLFEEFNLSGRQVEEMAFWLNRGTYTSDITKTTAIERIAKLSSAQVYFPKEILDKCNSIAMTFRQLADIYVGAARARALSPEAANKWSNELLPAFHKQVNECFSAILNELEKNRKRIL